MFFAFDEPHLPTRGGVFRPKVFGEASVEDGDGRSLFCQIARFERAALDQAQVEGIEESLGDPDEPGWGSLSRRGSESLLPPEG